MSGRDPRSNGGDRRLLTFAITPTRDEVLRLLGPGGNRVPRPSIRQLIDEELDGVSELLSPRAATRETRSGISGIGCIDGDAHLIAAACTIGPGTEHRIAELLERGESARAVVLDAIASAAVEETARECERSMCGRASKLGLALGRRQSPGLAGWPLEDQRPLLEFLGAGEIGLELSASAMMIPEKSVSFVLPLIGDSKEGRARERCDICDLMTCRYRIEMKSRGSAAARQGEGP